MTDPRFRPSTYTLDPQLFGRTPKIRWRSVPDGLGARSSQEAVQLGVSQLQHQLAYSIRELARTTGRSIQELAAEFQISTERMNRMLRGDVLMRLEDVVGAELIFNKKLIEPKAAASLFTTKEQTHERSSKP